MLLAARRCCDLPLNKEQPGVGVLNLPYSLADCSHYNCHHMLCIEYDNVQSDLVQVLNEIVVKVAVATVCWSYEFYSTLSSFPDAYLTIWAWPIAGCAGMPGARSSYLAFRLSSYLAIYLVI